MAKATELRPSIMAAAVASEQTSAVCELGMPPLLNKNHRSRRLSPAIVMIAFSSWAMAQATTGISNALLVMISYNKYPDVRSFIPKSLVLASFLRRLEVGTKTPHLPFPEALEPVCIA